jgi:hypothetical protein
MLRRCVARLGGGHGHEEHRGLHLDEMYVNGVPRRTFPYFEHPITPLLMPPATGFYVTRKQLAIPMLAGIVPSYSWRQYMTLVLLAIFIDMTVGTPNPFIKDKVPGRPVHNFFNNNGGQPHHWWQYQDGWSLPNQSGVRRWMD